MADGATAVDRALGHLLARQDERGAWEAEMVWCTMILSQYVIVQRIVGRHLPADARGAIARHYEATRTADGGWGLHPESPPYLFTTALAYVALRVLGLPADAPLTSAARRWLRAQPDGMFGLPTWGKFWLALVDLYAWDGVNPASPELFLLPRWLPIHPRRFYCHTRAIYTAMAYLQGRRFVANLGRLGDELRDELYGWPYAAIDFRAHRHTIAATDLHVRPAAGLRRAYDALALYERRPLPGLRRRALRHCFERIVYEQRASRYQALSPVNGLLDCLALFAESRDHPDLPASLDGLETWKWEDAAEGRRYVGARSCTWDTAFAVEAVLAGGTVEPAAADALTRAYGYLRTAQLTTEIPGRLAQDRDPVLGGWCFSDGRHGWPVSDCTAEALTAVLAVHGRAEVDIGAEARMTDDRLIRAVEFVLDRQNADGGFATYERRRGARLLEALNPSEMYGDCMTERSYIECTGSALTALAAFRAAHPSSLRRRLDSAIARGVGFLRRAQLSDGSYPAFWGIGRTYGTFHAVRGLRAAGVAADDPALRRAAAWLVSAQKADGGWGEHFSGCLTGQYVEHPRSQAVMTSWALLSLLEIIGPEAEAVGRGVAWLVARQEGDGSWPAEAVNGVFFGTAMLDYRLYRAYFPAWALARYAALRAAGRPGTPVAARLDA